MSLRIFTAVFIAILSARAASAQVAPTGTWTAKANGPAGRAQAASASDGTYLYVFGGGDLDAGRAETFRYDPLANTWATMNPMPEVVAVHAGAYYNGSVYSFGNWDGDRDDGPIFRYVIATDTWTVLPAVLTGNWVANGAATVGDRIYITGGFAPNLTNATTEFNPADGSVVARAPMPAGTAYHSSWGLNGKLYVTGGGTTIFSGESGGQNFCFEYTPSTNTWLTRAPMPVAREMHVMFGLRDKVYVCGGRVRTTYFNTLYEYNPANNTWTQRANMAETRVGHVGATVGSRAYVFGNGAPGQPWNTTAEYAAPAFGLVPNAATNVQQRHAGQPLPPGGMTGASFTAVATITDPDATDRIQLEVQVRQTGGQWAAAATSPLAAQGQVSFSVPIPSSGSFEWRYRAWDENGNSTPAVPNFTEFAPSAAADFQSDQTLPGATSILYPLNQDVSVFNLQGGPVPFSWTAAVDASPVTYIVEIYEGTTLVSGAAGVTSTSVSIVLVPSPVTRSWKVRGVDQYGNLGPWSALSTFRVGLDDGINHSEGDAEKACGFGAGSSTGILVVMAALLLIRTVRRLP